MRFLGRSAIALVLLGLALSATVAAAGPRGASARLSRPTDLGRTTSSRLVTITAWLRMRQTGVLEQTVQAQQDPTSPSFERWSDDAAVDAAHAPTSADVATVRSY